MESWIDWKAKKRGDVKRWYGNALTRYWPIHGETRLPLWNAQRLCPQGTCPLLVLPKNFHKILHILHHLLSLDTSLILDFHIPLVMLHRNIALIPVFANIRNKIKRSREFQTYHVLVSQLKWSSRGIWVDRAGQHGRLPFCSRAHICFRQKINLPPSLRITPRSHDRWRDWSLAGGADCRHPCDPWPAIKQFDIVSEARSLATNYLKDAYKMWIAVSFVAELEPLVVIPCPAINHLNGQANTQHLPILSLYSCLYFSLPPRFF